jgi:hypothetical protein
VSTYLGFGPWTKANKGFISPKFCSSIKGPWKLILLNIKFFEEIHAPTFTICFYKLQGGLHKAVFVFVVHDV